MLLKAIKYNNLYQSILLFLISLIFLFISISEYGYAQLHIYINYAILIFEAVFIGFIAKKHQISRNGLIVGCIYFCLAYTLFPIDYIGKEQIISLLFLLSIYYTLNIADQRNNYPNILNMSFLFGCIGLIWPNFIFIYPLLLIIMLYLSNNTFREWIILIIGLNLPWLIYTFYRYLYDIEIDLSLYNFAHLWQDPIHLEKFSFKIIILSIVSIIGVFYILTNTKKRNTNFFRKKKNIIINIIFAYTVIFSIINLEEPKSLIICLFPMAFLFGKFIEKKEFSTVLCEIVFIIFILLNIINAIVL